MYVHVQAALSKMKGVTAIHLVKRSVKGPTAQKANITTEGRKITDFTSDNTPSLSPHAGMLYAYCSTCQGLSKIRPIFQCSSCKMVCTCCAFSPVYKHNNVSVFTLKISLCVV